MQQLLKSKFQDSLLNFSNLKKVIYKIMYFTAGYIR